MVQFFFIDLDFQTPSLVCKLYPFAQEWEPTFISALRVKGKIFGTVTVKVGTTCVVACDHSSYLRMFGKDIRVHSFNRFNISFSYLRLFGKDIGFNDFPQTATFRGKSLKW